MPVDVQSEIVIDLPRERVSEYATDPSHAPEWYANIESVEWETPPPLRVGSRLAFVARFLLSVRGTRPADQTPKYARRPAMAVISAL
jgi:hypothetical protein